MTTRPAPGARLTFRWRKWDGSPHWAHECVYLGSDEWGDWVGQWPGALSSRPGRELRAEGPNVTLMPPDGEWAATFNASHPRMWIYIDVAWQVGWRGGEPEGIDMDLDVIHATDERGIFVDDRDEWDEHAQQFGYPPEVMARLERVTADLERRVTASTPPFDEATSARWLAVLAELGPGPGSGNA
ncbi:DUF402 domain-containing protein [Microbacterium invictum]|uniref:DUF402 domain-containing protein n=1 Tax=Microbacterium invictum TaxID=515415 RepID=A0AA40SL78_9MICO|nr:DUF402 domain-containing protein [Microbacterium invictum]MBB4138293.1 hypothetical protein [Microbacterium invictum]